MRESTPGNPNFIIPKFRRYTWVGKEKDEEYSPRQGSQHNFKCFQWEPESTENFKHPWGLFTYQKMLNTPAIIHKSTKLMRIVLIRVLEKQKCQFAEKPKINVNKIIGHCSTSDSTLQNGFVRRTVAWRALR